MGGSDGRRGGVQGASNDSWMYVDVFNGGVELSDDELRCVAGAGFCNSAGAAVLEQAGHVLANSGLKVAGIAQLSED
jgi:hypothetical protein